MSKFRNNNGQLLTMTLLLELSRDKDRALYSISREGVEGYPNLFQAYMEMEDFTEYEFATRFFESYQHWKRICKQDYFAPIISEWREELELKVKARNLKSLINKAESDSGVAKYLLGNSWVDKAQEKNKVPNLRGRPSKEEIKKHLTLITNENKQIDDDYERIKQSS
ncbi:MAG: hypothetical protein GF334_13450 [Candidatus Altiarchaeales archaeon]|nr:hypothetical protein [Candidatus Altiarchaeales archaeon]